LGTVAGARVGRRDDQFVLNPSAQDMPYHHIDLIVAGTKEGVLMVESEIAELPEDLVLEGVKFGHEACQDMVKFIDSFVKEAGKPKWAMPDTKDLDTLTETIWKKAQKKLEKIFEEKEKVARGSAAKELLAELVAELGEKHGKLPVERAFKRAAERVVRANILKKKRIDGRTADEIRPIATEIRFLPRPHGNALFTRGETQAIVVVTLGAADDAQLVDALDGEYKEAFLLHYNFPPFSVGEAGRLGPPGRREVGHGKLAWRAIRPVLPFQEEFPYTLRVVSEITESNGSSSMATVCGTTLALMDAGVPLKRPVAGIAMGLVLEDKNCTVLSDILADEDSLGDMDFKVAGTEQGITALQMDIKITSVTPQIMKKALAQAVKGYQHILKVMLEGHDLPRKALHQNAPRMKTLQISQDKIRDVIGPGGKVIREICETTGAKIDIGDSGVVNIFAPDEEALEKALSRVNALTYVPQKGDVFDGKVVSIQDFGAFVNFMNQDGLVHISEISDKRVNKVADVLKLGQAVRVKVIGVDNRGKVKLSMKQA
jgi:polyribonucleotide nucleotidyltransferase